MKEIYLYLKSPSDDILESYRFRLRYNPEASKEFESKPEPPEVKEHVLRLLQVLHNLKEIQKLDVGTKAVVEFTYNQGECLNKLHNCINIISYTIDFILIL